jgi:hypothetical protein
MAKCENEKCDKEATHAVTLNVPAKDIPIDLHAPIKMYVGVELCLEHAKEFGADFSWSENQPLREAIEATLAATGRSEPDFERTFHSTVPINHHGYQQFLKVQSERSSS